jgi:hypothetical protein
MRILALLVGCLAAFASTAGTSVAPVPNLEVDRSWSDHFEYGQFSEAVTDRASIEPTVGLDVVITRQNAGSVVIVDRRSSDPPIKSWSLAIPTRGGEHCGQKVLAIPVATCSWRPTIQVHSEGGRHWGLKVLAIP